MGLNSIPSLSILGIQDLLRLSNYSAIIIFNFCFIELLLESQLAISAIRYNNISLQFSTASFLDNHTQIIEYNYSCQCERFSRGFYKPFC